MKNMRTLIAATVVAIASITPALAGQAFEDLKLGEVVPKGATVAGKPIKMADGDVWIKSAKRMQIGERRVEIQGEQGQKPGVAYMHLVKDGTMIARRVVDTNVPTAPGDDGGSYASCTYKHGDLARFAIALETILCGGVKATPMSKGTSLDIDKVEVTEATFVREHLFIDLATSDRKEVQLAAAEATIWLSNGSNKSVTSLLTKSN